jgi:hypothetical protein
MAIAPSAAAAVVMGLSVVLFPVSGLTGVYTLFPLAAARLLSSLYPALFD